MYAKKKKLPLTGNDVELHHSKIYAVDCLECTNDAGATPKKGAKIDRIERKITLHGPDLTEAQRKRMFTIANMCPVHRTLESSNNLVLTSLAESDKSEKESADLPRMELERIVEGRVSLLPSSTKPVADDDPTGFTVRRIFPFRERRSIGPFIFADHMGPADTRVVEPINVGPHPHIGLSTLTYLYSGLIRHRDSTGADCDILPGEVNWMTAGRGVVHSERGRIPNEMEVSAMGLDANANERYQLHGMQLWCALSLENEDCEPSFLHVEKKHLPDISKQLSINMDNHTVAKLVAGSLPLPDDNGELKMVSTPVINDGIPMFIIDLDMKTEHAVQIPFPKGYEVAVFAAEGTISCDGSTVVEQGQCAVYINRADADNCSLHLESKSATARIMLFGGVPLPHPAAPFSVTS